MCTHQTGDQRVGRRIRERLAGEVDDRAERARHAQAREPHEIALVDHHLTHRESGGAGSTTAGRGIHTHLVSPGRQSERSVDPGGRATLRDQVARKRETERRGTLHSTVGLVEGTERLVDRVQLPVEQGGAQLGEGEIVFRKHAGQSHDSIVAGAVG